MIQYLIIDDEPIAHDIIKGYCDMLPEMQLMQHCYDAIEALAYLKKQQVDLIFLDLNMPKLKGFDLIKTLQTVPRVIVTTAHHEFALEGYEYNISDYLLKPFSFERFLKAVNKAFVNEASIRTGLASEQVPKRIFLQTNKKYIQIELASLRFVEAIGNYVKVFTTTEVFTIREKLSGMLELIPGNRLLQVHRSYAVAVDHITSLEGDRILIGDQIIPIGRSYRANVENILRIPPASKK